MGRVSGRVASLGKDEQNQRLLGFVSQNSYFPGIRASGYRQVRAGNRQVAAGYSPGSFFCGKVNEINGFSGSFFEIEWCWGRTGEKNGVAH